MRSILIIDDDEDFVEILKRAMSSSSYNILTAYDGASGIQSARRHQPDLIFLDIIMPGIDGYEVCRTIRADKDLQGIPIVMLSGKDGVDSKVAGLNIGADDYLTKPITTNELVARVASIIRRQEMFQRLTQENQELKISNKIFRSQSFTDEITRLPNERYLRLRLKEELLRSAKFYLPCTCTRIIIDNQEKTNKLYGKEAMKYAIQEVSRLLMRLKRLEDILFHLGDGDFVLLMFNTEAGEANLLLDKWREAVKSHDFRYQGDSMRITVSIGSVTTSPHVPVTDVNVILPRMQEAVSLVQMKGGDGCAVLKAAPGTLA